MNAGYSGTPLAKKLGIGAGSRKRLRGDAVLRVSGPKKASMAATDITEDGSRELALSPGWVDVKVCAVDAVWSRLNLVVRRELRGTAHP